jgi:hypothetical protein
MGGTPLLGACRKSQGRKARILPVPAAPANEPTDPRALRFEQVVVTIALLAGFVFGIPLVIPVVAVLLAIALGAGSRANVFTRAHEAIFRRTLPPAAAVAYEPPAVTRLTRLVEVGLLALGSLFVAFGVGALPWVFALPVAAITGLAATTGINLVARLNDRRR